jgi:hypothetical protein
VQSAIRLSLFLLASFVSSCAFFQAITFEADEATSFKKEDTKVRLTLYHANVPEECIVAPHPAEEGPKFAPVLGAAAVSLALNLAESELTSYLDKKKKEFTAIYGNAISQQYAYAPPDLNSLAYNCLEIIRTVTDGGKPNQDAFRFVASVIPSPNGSASVLRPELLRLTRAAAKTDNKSRKLDITVEVKIDAVSLGTKTEPVVTSIADKTLTFSGVVAPTTPDAAVDLTRGTDCKGRPISNEATGGCLGNGTSWFVSIPKSSKERIACKPNTCKGITPITVAVLVTETGAGADNFGAARSEIDDNKKTVNDAIQSAVKDALTKAPSKK